MKIYLFKLLFVQNKQTNKQQQQQQQNRPVPSFAIKISKAFAHKS